MRVMVAFGTRPEFVKLAPVIRALIAGGHRLHTVATGQHYDADLSDVFLEELGIDVDERWDLAREEAERVGQMVTYAYRSVDATQPAAVMVLGDTYTVPLFALAARRHRVPLIHLEAGLRSFNATSMEEVNRRVAAATAQLHLAPTTTAAENLEREGVDRHAIEVVGNPVLDAVRSLGVARIPVPERHGVTLTLHRASNVDDEHRLARLLTVLGRLVECYGEVVFPIHPRTRARVQGHGLEAMLDHPGVRVVEPLPYSAMLRQIARSKLVVTDSGGLQEEAAWFGVPVVVLRPTTPRPEGVAAGIAAAVGPDVDAALAAAAHFARPQTQAYVADHACPYGDGHTAQRVVEILERPTTAALLRLDEPPAKGWP